MKRSILALVAALPLAGCISFGDKPPAQLLTLTAATQIAAGTTLTARPGEAITVLPPSVPQALSTARIPVTSGGTAIAYIKDAQWIEPPNRLFQRVLSETIEARSGRSVLSPRQTAFDPGIRVTGDLSQFGVDEASRSAVVRYDATVARKDSIQTRRFEARVPVSEIKPAAAGAALNAAANKVAAEVSDWVTGETPAPQQ